MERNASLFAKHAELAFGPGPWATYKPEPAEVPEAFQMALDTARAIAHEVETKGLHIVQVGWTLDKGSEYIGFVVVVPETFYKIFDERPFEYVQNDKNILLRGRIDGVEVNSWLL